MTEEKLDSSPLQWAPGMEITSAEHYNALVDELAQRLLKESSPEQLAAIAAQHLIYADALSESLVSVKEDMRAANELIATQGEIIALLKIESRSKLTVRQTARMAHIILDAKHKQRARKAALASHKENHAGKAKALADWDAHGAKFSSRRAFAERCHAQYGVTSSDTVYRWLLKHRPEKKDKAPPT
ncbi:hypothetical protein [Halopseudomonas aestusnigri]|jgi:hypothetical protein|uniref:hypothetical protein n=1 Tax=Halopseudomonas aestusnigri TaxID=857252 RepID=UPI003002407B|tara:strand:+ start:4339 stop:4896 length:558 start_codon:yes stop_codon:yes gene_type:complete